jgi:hypothetical protein
MAIKLAMVSHAPRGYPMILILSPLNLAIGGGIIVKIGSQVMVYCVSHSSLAFGCAKHHQFSLSALVSLLHFVEFVQSRLRGSRRAGLGCERMLLL